VVRVWVRAREALLADYSPSRSARGPIKWVTSNDTIANMTVIRDHGMLLSSCSMATNVFLDLLMKLCAFCGFQMSAYSSMMARCSNLATQRLVDQAAELGANAVVNVRFQTKATIGTRAPSHGSTTPTPTPTPTLTLQ